MLDDKQNPATQYDETFLTPDDHSWLAEQLFNLRRALIAMQRDAPTQVEHAVQLLDALAAGLIHDYMAVRSDLPPYLVDSARPAFPAGLPEISKIIEAKVRRDCVRATARRLVAAVERVQETDESPSTSISCAEYQQVIEHLAVLGNFLQVLHHTSYRLIDDGGLWGLSANELQGLGYP